MVIGFVFRLVGEFRVTIVALDVAWEERVRIVDRLDSVTYQFPCEPFFENLVYAFDSSASARGS